MEKKVIEAFFSTSIYLDDLLNIDDAYFKNWFVYSCETESTF